MITTDDLAQALLRLEKAQERTDAQLAKTDAQLEKTTAKIDKLAEMYGGASNNQGYAAEAFFYNSLAEEPELLGLSFDSVTKNVRRRKGKVEDEFDLILVNGADVLLIEVKYRGHSKHLTQLIEKKAPNFRCLFPEFAALKLHLALAVFSADDLVMTEARQQQISILQRKGDVFETLAA